MLHGELLAFTQLHEDLAPLSEHANRKDDHGHDDQNLNQIAYAHTSPPRRVDGIKRSPHFGQTTCSKSRRLSSGAGIE